MNATAILFRAPHEVAVDSVDVPEPGAGELLIRTAFSGISPGTELRCLAGNQPGLPGWPFIPGYSLSGVVEKVGPGTEILPGSRVYAPGTRRASVQPLWGGHCSHVVCEDSKVVLLPDQLSLKQAAMLKLAAISAHGVRLSDSQAREKVAVIGLGPIGLISALLHHDRGADVVATDLQPQRRQHARAYGLCVAEPDGSLASTFARYFGQGADVVVDGTGAPAVLDHALELLSSPAWDNAPQIRRRLVIQGSYPDRISFNYQQAFLRQAEVQFPRDAQKQDLEWVAQAAAVGRIDLDCLLEETCPRPEQAAETYRRLHEAPASLVSTCFDWS